MEIINRYIENGIQITEFDNGYIVKEQVPEDLIIEPPIPQPTNSEIQETQMTILSGIADVYMATLGF